MATRQPARAKKLHQKKPDDTAQQATSGRRSDISPPENGTDTLAALTRIERQLDQIAADTRGMSTIAVKSGALSGAVAGGISGALVATAIALIRARMGL